MIILDVPQRSDEWFKARLGVVTASAANAIQPKNVRMIKTYLLKLISEQLTGDFKSISINDAMQWGIDKEDEARKWYEAKTGNRVTEVGFIYQDDTKLVGCSPDGLVGEDGLLEIKCPNSENHLLQMDEGPKLEYRYQMDFQMMVTGRKWCDFVTYDPRFPEPFNGRVIRRERDEAKIEQMQQLVNDFLKKKEQFLEELRSELL